VPAGSVDVRHRDIREAKGRGAPNALKERLAGAVCGDVLDVLRPSLGLEHRPGRAVAEGIGRTLGGDGAGQTIGEADRDPAGRPIDEGQLAIASAGRSGGVVDLDDLAGSNVDGLSCQ
jgi:hypothetical protein